MSIQETISYIYCHWVIVSVRLGMVTGSHSTFRVR